MKSAQPSGFECAGDPLRVEPVACAPAGALSGGSETSTPNLKHIHKVGAESGSDLKPFSDELKTSVEGRCEKYGQHKLASQPMAAWLREQVGIAPQNFEVAQVGAVADALDQCGAWLVFREYCTIGETRLTAANFCGRWKLCPMCALRRSSRMLRGYAPKVMSICEQRTLQPWMVTLTVKDGENLTERMDHLRGSWKRLWKRKKDWDAFVTGAKRRRQAHSSLEHVKGGASSIEVHRGENSGLWHPHLHAVMLVEKGHQIDRVGLSEEWRKVTGDSFIVHPEPFRSMHLLQHCETFDQAQQLLAGDLVECFKYACKFQSMAPADVWDVVNQSHGARFFNAFGCLWGHKVAEEDMDAPLELDDVPYIEAMARFTGDGYTVERGGEGVGYVEALAQMARRGAA